MTLRVALVSLYPVPRAKSPGGVRAVVQNLVRGLRAYPDLQVHVIHCHADISASTTIEEGNVRADYIAMPRSRLLPNTLGSISRVAQLLRSTRPDVVNSHAAHYTVAALRTGCPTIFTIHGVLRREAQVYRSSWFDRSRFALEQWLESYALHRVQDIVAISPYVMEEYRSRTAARFHRIDNPLPAEFFTLADSGEDGRLLYAGTIDERKNVLDLLRAVDRVRAQVPGVQLRIAGRTTQREYERQLRAFVATRGLQPHVQFLGLQDAAQMLEEYARCAAVVLASRQETAPMAVLEAMAAGKPVVATRVGGVADLLEDGGSGFVVAAGDVEAMAQRMAQLLQDSDLRRRMGAQGRRAAEGFRVETVAARYRELYYQVAGRPAP